MEKSMPFRRLQAPLLTLALTLAHMAPASAADDPVRLGEIFREGFVSMYAPGGCGNNILRLVMKAEEARIPLKDAQVVVLENEGGSVFGMLNVESARDARWPGEKNWYFHVILVHGGLVYDFDYTNDPIVDTIEDYFERMFLREERRPPDGFLVGRDNKLDDYSVRSVSPREYIQARSRGEKPRYSEKIWLRKYLESAASR
jgi:hypothetical protein